MKSSPYSKFIQKDPEALVDHTVHHFHFQDVALIVEGYLEALDSVSEKWDYGGVMLGSARRIV